MWNWAELTGNNVTCFRCNMTGTFHFNLQKKCEYPTGYFMFKVNRTRICSKLTIKIPERRYWPRSGVFTVKFEHVSHLVLVFLLLTLNRQMLSCYDWVLCENGQRRLNAVNYFCKKLHQKYFTDAKSAFD